MPDLDFDIIVVGGGAAGFFAAINAAEMNPRLRIAILERSQKVLSKVKVSGGGRCNVTHAEYIPAELAAYYPRGQKELLGPFHHFMTGDVVAWFEERGVPLKTEADGRMFPVSNDSQTILDCFINLTDQHCIEVLTKQSVTDISKTGERWTIRTTTHTFTAQIILLATGSDARTWEMLAGLGHTIVPPVPSLFTFHIKDDRIRDLPGVASEAFVRVLDTKKEHPLETSGPLLITHWGMSGPAILKLSAWGARILHSQNYRFAIEVNWLPHLPPSEVADKLKSLKNTSGKQSVLKNVQFGLPRRLWINLVSHAGISPDDNWGDISKNQINDLTAQLTAGRFEVNGKSTFKEEFVTAGGVDLREINFKTFESKIVPGLFLAGEILNIDALTGGFNFQNAWTGGYLAAKAMDLRF